MQGSKQAIGIALIAVGLLLVAGWPVHAGPVQLSTVCGTNCTSPGTEITSIQIGPVYLSTNPTDPTVQAAEQSTMTVNYALAALTSLDSYSLQWCIGAGIIAQNDTFTCSSSQMIPLTDNGGVLTGQSPSMTLAGTTYYYIAKISDSDGTIAMFYGATTYSPDTYQATFHVVSSQSDQPISGASIKVFTSVSSTSPYASLTTNQNGLASFFVPVGSYTAIGQAPGYVTTNSYVFAVTSAGGTVNMQMQASTSTTTATTSSSTHSGNAGATVYLSQFLGFAIVAIGLVGFFRKGGFSS